MRLLSLAFAGLLVASSSPPMAQPFAISEGPYTPQTYLLHREVVPLDALQPFYMAHLPGAYAAALAAGLAPAGPATGLYWSWDEDAGTADMAAAVPVSGEADGALPEAYTLLTPPPGNAAVLAYYGGYDGLGAAHQAMGAYLGDRAESATLVLEEYVTDPTTQPDPDKILTRIVYLVPAADQGGE